MYVYTQFDQKLVDERVEQYRDQTRRYLNGSLPENDFLPLRLQNGLYVQRHAPMLRVAIPYGLMSSKQMRMFGLIAKKYDKDYGHISTRQNIQFNWPHLKDVPDILADLASVQMHAIQTSGNCIRNITTDQFAGAIADEIEDPRPYCEVLRQWSTFHPEFAYLPRKFKIAVSATDSEDRAAVKFHDIGLYLVKNEQGETGFEVMVGGGLGRTPIIGVTVREFLPKQHLISYLEAILRIYNRYGRRDNKYKARIKILVKALTPDVFREKIEAEWEKIKDGALQIPASEFERISQRFTLPQYEHLENQADKLAQLTEQNPAFSNWLKCNTFKHKQVGYMLVTLSLKKTAQAPGDITGDQMNAVADLADRYSFGEVRSTHEQNLVLADVKQADLYELWLALSDLGLATANIAHLTDIICCPGGDFCALANAKSIPIAEEIQRRFDDLDYLYDLGEISLNISGCMNACGHHHIGHIGILGVDKRGKEYYQISIGGSAGKDASIGQILGPAFEPEEVVKVLDKIIAVYVEHRHTNEPLISTYRRIGISPFKERVYAKNN